MRDHNFFEGYCRRNQMVPQGYVDTPEGRVLLADSDGSIMVDGQMVYRTGYTIQRYGVSIGNHHDYEWHLSGASETAKQERLDEATTHARVILKQLIETGYYDDGRKNDFSPRPRN